jgi:hypothetical protein
LFRTNQGRLAAEFRMGDLVNLRIARKRAKRREAEQAAATKRLIHGRATADRKLDQSRHEQAQKRLEQHRIETGERK